MPLAIMLPMSKEPIPDAPRQRLAELMRQHGLNMKAVSHAIGKNDAYIQQYLKKGTPAELPERIRLALANLFGVNQQEFRAEPAAAEQKGALPTALNGDTRTISPEDWFAEHVQASGGIQALASSLGRDVSEVKTMLEARQLLPIGEVPAIAAHFGVSTYELMFRYLMPEDMRAAPARRIEVRGHVQAGMWRDALEWDEAERYSIEVPAAAAAARAEIFGLEVRGESMNRRYPAGTIVVCVPAWQMRPPSPGQPVVVLRHSPSGAEATVKIFRPGDNGEVWLWPDSTHPEFQAPIRLNDRTIETQVTAIVIGSYRPEPPVNP